MPTLARPSAFVTRRSRIVPPQLKTRLGTELLIQSEIDSVVNDWYRALTETVNTHVRTDSLVHSNDHDNADNNDNDDSNDDDELGMCDANIGYQYRYWG